MKVNGQKVKLVKLNETNIKKLAESGASLENHDQKSALRFVVGMLALSWNCSTSEAMRHIQQHIKNGGDISPLIDACNRAVEKRNKKLNNE